MTVLLSLPFSASAADKEKMAEGKPESRCGWVDNPTPANWTLTDKDGAWLVHSQGDYQAQGEMPDFGTTWVKTNGNHGYGCACMQAVVDHKNKRVVSYKDVKILPLKKCKNDKNISQQDRK